MADNDRINQFLRLHAQHESRLHGFILSLLPNWNDAQDVLQETVTVLWKKFDQFEPGTSYFAWACQIARYEISRFARRQQRDRLTFSDAVLDALTQDSVNIGDDLADRQVALALCLEKLPNKDGTLIRMQYREGLTVKRIAGRVGRSVHAIYKARSRIYRALYRCVTETLAREGTS